MSLFIKLADHGLCDEHAIRAAAYPAALPEVLRDEDLELHGFAAVAEGDIPELKPWQELGSELVEVNGEYKITYSAVESANALAIRAATIADKRYQIETGGIELQGGQIPTDRHTQQVLTAMFLRASADPQYTVRFKTIGGFITLDAAQIIVMANAVHDHVQAAFDRENELLAALENGELVSGEDW